jgi:hypothetical protein
MRKSALIIIKRGSHISGHIDTYVHEASEGRHLFECGMQRHSCATKCSFCEGYDFIRIALSKDPGINMLIIYHEIQDIK